MALDFQVCCDFEVPEEQYWIGFIVFEQKRQENGEVRPHITGLEIAAMELMVGQQGKFLPFSIPEELRQRFRFDTRVRTRFLCRIKNFDEAFLAYPFAQEVYFFVGSKTGQPLSNLLAPLEVALFVDAGDILDTFRISPANWGGRALAWRIAQRKGAHLELALGKAWQPDTPEQEDMAAFFARQHLNDAPTAASPVNRMAQAAPPASQTDKHAAANHATPVEIAKSDTATQPPPTAAGGVLGKTLAGLVALMVFALAGIVVSRQGGQPNIQTQSSQTSQVARSTALPLPDIPDNYCMRNGSNLRSDGEISVPLGVERRINTILSFAPYRNHTDIGNLQEVQDLPVLMARSSRRDINHQCLASINGDPKHLQVLEKFDEFKKNPNFSMENYLRKYKILFVNNIGDAETASHAAYLQWLGGPHWLAQKIILLGLASDPTDPYLWLLHGITTRIDASNEEGDVGASGAVCLGYQLLAENKNDNRLSALRNFVKQAESHDPQKAERLKKLLTNDVAAACKQYVEFSRKTFYE